MLHIVSTVKCYFRYTLKLPRLLALLRIICNFAQEYASFVL